MATTGTDHTATTERDLLMRVPPNLALTLMPKLTRGTATTAMVTGLTDMATSVTDTTTERDLLMRSPNLALTLMPKLTPGMVTTAMVTGLTVMATADKKWTSKNNIRSFPACRLICKTPVFAKQFSFYSFEKQFCFVY